MPEVARKGDMVVSDGATCNPGFSCCPHSWTGIIESNLAETVITNGKPTAVINGEGPIQCPHGGTFEIIEGSSTVFAEGRKVARIGDKVKCKKCGGMGHIAQGSPDVFAGG